MRPTVLIAPGVPLLLLHSGAAVAAGSVDPTAAAAAAQEPAPPDGLAYVAKQTTRTMKLHPNTSTYPDVVDQAGPCSGPGGLCLW